MSPKTKSLENTTMNSFSRGVSIRVRNSSEYSPMSQRQRRVRAGSTARVGRGRPVGRGGDTGDWKPILRASRLGNAARQVAISSGEMYPDIGTSTRPRLVMWVADKMNLGNVGNGMPYKKKDFKSGADPPKKVSGSTGTDLLIDLR